MTDQTEHIAGQALIYATPDGKVRVEVLYDDETFWLSQKRIAELFGVDLRTVSEHLRNIYASGELTKGSTIRKSRITAADGRSHLISLYNLDAVISVGYRVNSRQATQFRIWTTRTLKEFIVKGTEELAAEIATMTGESTTQAIRQALRERRDRLALHITPAARRTHLRRFLEREVWATIPKDQLCTAPDKAEREQMLGYGPRGV